MMEYTDKRENNEEEEHYSDVETDEENAKDILPEIDAKTKQIQELFDEFKDLFILKIDWDTLIENKNYRYFETGLQSCLDIF